MFDLIRKDILVLIKSDKLFLIRYVLTVLLIYTILNPISYYLSSIFLSYVTLISTFSYDQENDSSRFIMSMPINKENIVYSRYILSLIFIFISTVINNTLFEILSGKIYRGPVFNDVLICLILYLLTVSLILPLHFKFKNKRIVNVICIFLFLIILLKVGKFLNLIVDTASNNVNNFFDLYNLSFISIGIFIVSMTLSLIIVKNNKGGKSYEEVY
ncbi:ABC-2 transporter permease [Romboutsia sp. 1001713B170207_170306_H8]|uniref:ABC-2 transporter permease n=1 Tax=Romboutsia sp. 1001713B170207_170306_H8 TaxID=2787112 RepID=UPI00082165C7|nr:ABC-2 transporter permease [Romboutsia sp. 1001713B170207_170306_H8]SCH30703.1 Uncharacterised protein [uncultured Clostridium sp.]